MELLIKKLRSQESGYSGDRPDQRGKYILIGKKDYNFFPSLSEGIFNDTRTVVFNTRDKQIALNYVWHNAKFHLDITGGKRAHDERRLYRNRDIDEDLRLDRKVIVLILKNQDKYAVTSVPEGDQEYAFWEHEDNQSQTIKNEYDNKKSFCELKNTINIAYNTVENAESISSDVIERISKNRSQQPGAPGDPSECVSALIKTQSQFSDYIRRMYGGKCAIRGSSLVAESLVGMEAAHIKPDSEQGPLLPANGILMSSDIHKAFDRGIFTLNEESKIEVHNKVPKDSEMWEFNKQEILPVKGYKIFKPYYKYIEFHRNNIFGKYQN